MLKTVFTIDSHYFPKPHERVIYYSENVRLYILVEMKVIKCFKIYTFRSLDFATYQAVSSRYQIAYVRFNLEAVCLRPLA
jgi:hypothetical protein